VVSLRSVFFILIDSIPSIFKRKSSIFSRIAFQRVQAMDTAHKISKNGAYNETFKKSSVKIPDPDPPKAENQKKKLITKTRKKDKTNFVVSW